MKQNSEFQYYTGVIGYPVLFILIIWFVYWFEVKFNVNLNYLGIYPLKFSGLRGVLFSPFIHGSLKHLYHNTIPLFVLSMALFYFYKKIAWQVIIYGALLSGIMTWCMARSSYHIGASSLIYVLMSFLFFKGLLARHIKLIAVSLTVIFIYGSMIWFVFPIKEGVSWEGHLSGFVIGFLFSLMFKNKIVKPKVYYWQQDFYDETTDVFMQHFDADGNFIENFEEE